jgi:hypothetical protein
MVRNAVILRRDLSQLVSFPYERGLVARRPVAQPVLTILTSRMGEPTRARPASLVILYTT